ncbi:unnamed protein product, partial [Closterium sp. NIES-54]
LREWYAARQRGGGTGPCTYVLRTGDRTGEQCGGAHPTHRCIGRLTVAWRHQFPEATEIPRWGELSRAGVAIFHLDFDAILAAMYAVTISDEGDCYRCFPPDPGIETAALGAGEAAALGVDSRPLPCSRPSSARSPPVADLPCSRPLSRSSSAATPVAALPSPPVAASALQPPCRGPVFIHAALPRRAACCDAAPPGTEPRCPAEPRRPAEPRHPTEPRRPAEPLRTAEPRCPTACTVPSATAAMASPTVLTFDAEGRAIDFDVWVDDLQLFLQCDSRDGVSLFDHTSGVSIAPAATVDSTVRSRWTTHDAVARHAVRSHLPSAERAHFGQYKTAQSLYDEVVARYSSPATAALSRLMLPYLFPDLAAFATVADLITHLRTSDTR